MCSTKQAGTTPLGFIALNQVIKRKETGTTPLGFYYSVQPSIEGRHLYYVFTKQKRLTPLGSTVLKEVSKHVGHL